MSSLRRTFKVDRKHSDHEYLLVDVKNLGTVQIKAQPGGIVVDIYPLNYDGEAEPVADTWAHAHDLLPEEGNADA